MKYTESFGSNLSGKRTWEGRRVGTGVTCVRRSTPVSDGELGRSRDPSGRRRVVDEGTGRGNLRLLGQDLHPRNRRDESIEGRILLTVVLRLSYLFTYLFTHLSLLRSLHLTVLV